MNHRTGKLIAADFEPARALPAPTFELEPIEHTSDFGVLDAGATFVEPAPQRDMWEDERRFPWLLLLYLATVLLGASLPHIVASLQ